MGFLMYGSENDNSDYMLIQHEDTTAPFQMGSGAHPASYTMDTGSLCRK